MSPSFFLKFDQRISGTGGAKTVEVVLFDALSILQQLGSFLPIPVNLIFFEAKEHTQSVQ
ncbi:hypothetical protein Ciccas_014234 [Cichlidogyrus casuarinus]|uniref:Uncharacterized protein n=1 Tax=Cichlidogyrus casuarinus TaxID=1844966 RepID=A0ABD2PJM2_9PLAT